MTGAKVLEAIGVYRRELERLGIPKEAQQLDTPATDVTAMLAHCYAMLDEMEEFVAAGRMEKVYRWLGFVQGCLWACRVYTIDQLRHHNMP